MSQVSTLNPVGEVIEFFARGPSREEIAAFQLSDAARERLRELLHRNAGGNVTPDEAHELDQMVLLDDVVSLIRARARGAEHPVPGPSESNVIPGTTGMPSA